MPIAAVSPPISIVHSNVIGIYMGTLISGRPPMLSGSATAETQLSKTEAAGATEQPADQGEQRNAVVVEVHGLVQFVNRIRRVGVDLAETRPGVSARAARPVRSEFQNSAMRP